MFDNRFHDLNVTVVYVRLKSKIDLDRPNQFCTIQIKL
jgi:hypothetical protein